MFGKSEIKSLTGLRGIAACLVVIYHYTEAGAALPAGALRTVVQHGYLCVDLFFVLSGFVMAWNYADRLSPDRVDLSAYGRFIASRLGRIYPLYLIVTLVCLGLAASGATEFTLMDRQATAANLLLVQAWGIGASVCGPAWSISAELAAYVLLPALLWLALGSGPLRIGTSLFAVAVAYAVLPEMGTVAVRSGPLDVYSATNGASVFRCLAGFTLGLLCFRAAGVRVIWHLVGRSYAGTLLGLLSVLLMAIPGSDLAVVGVTASLVVALATETSHLARLLGSKAILWLGTVSYSIYLVHVPVAAVLRPVLRPYLGSFERYHASGAILFAIALGTSALTYRWIESPARTLSRRLLRRRSLASENRFSKSLS